MRTIIATIKRTLRGDRGERRAVTDGGAVADADERDSLRESEAVKSAPFWLPAALLVGLFVYGAIVWNLVISLTDLTGFAQPDYTNLDFENYVIAFTGGQPSYGDLTLQPIWNALQNTLVLMISFTAICLVVGLLLAILVDQEIRFENTFRTIYLLPMSLSFVVTAKFWLFMYNERFGLVNSVVTFFGFDSFGIVRNPQLALAGVIFALIWQYSGYAMVVYLAGLRAIPDEHFEAARVDGASTVRMYWRVILPQLRTATVSAMVVLMVFALKAFDFLYAMYNGVSGLGDYADILATQMFREAFTGSLNKSYGAAIAVILFAMALTVIAPYLYMQYQRGEL